jgi:hypothetical protein
MPKYAISRRGFLAGLGVSAALAPFVPLLQAEGAEPTGPKRLVLIFTPHGTVRDQWLPTGTEHDFALSPILSPLAPLKEKIAVIDGLRVIADTSVGAPHTKGMPLLWTASPLLEDETFFRDDGSGGYYYGWNSSHSVDQEIAAQISSEQPYRSLELGVRTSNSHPGHRMIYAGPQQPLSPEQDPYRLLTTLFANGSSASAMERLRLERASILDLVYPEVDRLKGKVGQSDQYKIEAHLTAIRDIEKSLEQPTECTPPVVTPGLTPNKMQDIPGLLNAQSQILAQALACDITRVASLQLSVSENDQNIYTWLGVDREVHHLITHENNPTAKEEMSTIYHWYSQQVAAFLTMLDSIPEGDGTVLDNTLVIWGSEIGRGRDHSFEQIPFVLAGGAGGAIPMGRFLQYPGVEHNRLLVSACQAMGLTETLAFGATDLGNGPLSGLM